MDTSFPYTATSTTVSDSEIAGLQKNPPHKVVRLAILYLVAEAGGLSSNPATPIEGFTVSLVLQFLKLNTIERPRRN
jgi:hypothetical protein